MIRVALAALILVTCPAMATAAARTFTATGHIVNGTVGADSFYPELQALAGIVDGESFKAVVTIDPARYASTGGFTYQVFIAGLEIPAFDPPGGVIWGDERWRNDHISVDPVGDTRLDLYSSLYEKWGVDSDPSGAFSYSLERNRDLALDLIKVDGVVDPDTFGDFTFLPANGYFTQSEVMLAYSAWPWGRYDIWTEFVITDLRLGVPEPATWALMIAGFGLGGTALRRSRLKTVAAS